MYPPTTSTMRIDRIEPSRRKKDRVLVFLEGGDLLRVTEQELLVFGLRPGLELPEQLLAQVEQSAKRSEMKARGARLTGSRMLSKKQVMEHLTRKGGDRELAEDTAQWLEELGAVDESAYAAAIARHYAAMGYGPGRVRQELQRRGIPQELWDDALALLPEGEEAIERFIRSKCKGKPLDRETQRKLAAALQRRNRENPFPKVNCSYAKPPPAAYFCRSFFLLSPAGADHIFIVYPESISLNAPLQDHKSTYQTSEETQHECIIYIPGLRQKPGEHRADDGPVPAGRTYRAGGLLRQRRGGHQHLRLHRQRQERGHRYHSGGGGAEGRR